MTIRNDRASFGVRSQLTHKRIPVNRNRVMGVSPNDTASQQRATLKGSVKTKEEVPN
jgi:hypothetical protein